MARVKGTKAQVAIGNISGLYGLSLMDNLSQRCLSPRSGGRNINHQPTLWPPSALLTKGSAVQGDGMQLANMLDCEECGEERQI